MNLMLGFIFICILLGLWAPARRQARWLIPTLAVLMVVFFWLTPHRM